MSGSVHDPTAGDWDSSSLAFAISRGPCTATPSVSSQRSALPRHAVVPSRFRVQVRRVAPRSPPPEPRPPEGAIQRRVRRRTITVHRALRGLSACLSRWSAAGGGCRLGGPRCRYPGAAVAVARHCNAGCAGEHHSVMGKSPAVVAEPAADLVHPDSLRLPLVFTSEPAYGPPPGVPVDCARTPLWTPRIGSTLPILAAPCSCLRSC